MSSTPPTSNPFAPPTARVDDVTLTGGLELAGRGQRLAAAFIDALIQGAAYWGVMAIGLSRLLPGTASVTGFSLGMVVGLIVSMVLFVLIQGYLLASSGQTIGKKLLGLRIVRGNGERAEFGRLISRRYLPVWAVSAIPVVGWIFALVDALMIFRDSRLCLHDNIADTVVVKA